MSDNIKSADFSVAPPAPHGPVPSARQLAWHRREFYGFMCFTTNTFTDKEWGYGDESPAIFNPTAFDPEQIVGVAAAAGMTGLILTCKHHDGFCLWPSRYTEHSVKNSPWRNGKGDVVREISEACRHHGIGFGVYLSPWDRNHAEYGRPAYLQYYRNQLEELTTEYGELFEVWFDGANGVDGYYGGAREKRTIDRRTYYDWPNTWEIVRRNQPHAVMFSDAGPDIRWVGNEEGIAGDPCWSTINRDLLFPGINKQAFTTLFTTDLVAAWGSPFAMLNKGDRQGTAWLPAECDVSIRPGWFYHAAEDEKVRSPQNLLDLYFQSVGRGASLLLNLPPDRRGQIHECDVRSVQGYRRLHDEIFGRNLAQGAQCTASNTRGNSARFAPGNVLDGNADTYWATDDQVTTPEFILTFAEPLTFNVVGLREYLPLGQRVGRFAIDVDSGGAWCEWGQASAIGNRRLLRGKHSTVRRLRLRILESPVCPVISELGIYNEMQMDQTAV
jgi:alpha-L-fucosidase